MSNSLDCAFIFCSHGWEGWVVVYIQTEQICNAVIQISAKTGTMHQYTRPSDPWGSPLSSISRQNQSFFCHWNYHRISPLTSKSVSSIPPSALPHGIPLADGNYSYWLFSQVLEQAQTNGNIKIQGTFSASGASHKNSCVAWGNCSANSGERKSQTLAELCWDCKIFMCKQSWSNLLHPKCHSCQVWFWTTVG